MPSFSLISGFNTSKERFESQVYPLLGFGFPVILGSEHPLVLDVVPSMLEVGCAYHSLKPISALVPTRSFGWLTSRYRPIDNAQAFDSSWFLALLSDRADIDTLYARFIYWHQWHKHVVVFVVLISPLSQGVFPLDLDKLLICFLHLSVAFWITFRQLVTSAYPTTFSPIS